MLLTFKLINLKNFKNDKMYFNKKYYCKRISAQVSSNTSVLNLFRYL